MVIYSFISWLGTPRLWPVWDLFWAPENSTWGMGGKRFWPCSCEPRESSGLCLVKCGATAKGMKLSFVISRERGQEGCRPSLVSAFSYATLPKPLLSISGTGLFHTPARSITYRWGPRGTFRRGAAATALPTITSLLFRELQGDEHTTTSTYVLPGQ